MGLLALLYPRLFIERLWDDSGGKNTNIILIALSRSLPVIDLQEDFSSTDLRNFIVGLRVDISISNILKTQD